MKQCSEGEFWGCGWIMRAAILSMSESTDGFMIRGVVGDDRHLRGGTWLQRVLEDGILLLISSVLFSLPPFFVGHHEWNSSALMQTME